MPDPRPSAVPATEPAPAPGFAAAATRVVLVTGTGTEVGKTVTTAALAATARRRGHRVVVVKVAQTGVAEGEPGDADEVARLAGRAADPAALGSIDVVELVRLRDPLAPDTAARREGVTLPMLADQADRIATLAGDGTTVIVEGSGGLLVHLDDQGGTIADLARQLLDLDLDVAVLVVAAAGLGTLNHTALTLEALSRRGLPVLGVVVGAWPDRPDLAARCNLEDLERLAGRPLLGVIPERAGRLAPIEFGTVAASWWSTPDVAGFLA